MVSLVSMRTEIMNDIIGKEMGNEMDGGLVHCWHISE